MSFDVGALVKVRGREWVVLPESNEDESMLILRPLGGTEDEITGIYLPLEADDVKSAEFPLPDPAADMGNQLSCGLLRDAVRLGFRSGAGPFRSLARIAVEPRPYQLVPLLMALKLDPIRMLIADDVGIGKTVEACLIARELIDRGEVRRLTVLCPPHLAEQWQQALNEQFHIDTALVLSGTAARLERDCRQDESLFERYPFTVVSTDYIKSDRRRHEFLRTCPEFVIVDEAHTCTAAIGTSGSQKRHELLQALVEPMKEEGAARHLVLVTATPHSGKDEAFRSLLSLLDRKLLDLPEDLSGDKNRRNRELLAKYFVQRRRSDLKAYLDSTTPFPEREIAEDHYSLNPKYRAFLDKVLAYCRETVLDETIDKRRQRVRWWSALALLRAISSSPAAAAATLRNRSGATQGETADQVDEEGRRAVLDQDDESSEGMDVVAGSDTGDEDKVAHRRLQQLASQADALAVKDDAKLAKALELVEKFLEDGHAPILFCRFIPTVGYVADYLRKKLDKKGVVVEAITGKLVPDERIRRVEALGENEKRVLVCTDCLSEGINLQQGFDAVMHYDLAWNPTRHEQREGRVDRYGQPKKRVRTLTFYGHDNPVDGVVLQVLLRKHKAIHKQLGVTVPVPMDTRVIEDAILEGLLLREHDTSQQINFDFLEPIHKPVDVQWDAAVEREKKSRTLFAQNQLLAAVNNEVRTELDEVRRAIGGEADVERFTRVALQSLGAVASDGAPLEVKLGETPRALRDAIGREDEISVVFSGQPQKGVELLSRTHPAVEGIASYVVETALDTNLDGPGKRCGVVRTAAVARRTTLLLLRLRFHIVNQGRDGKERPLLAEDLALVGFTGSPDKAEWLPPEELEPLLEAEATANIGPDQARDATARIIDRLDPLLPYLDQVATERGDALLDAHRRVRKATKSGVRALKVDVHTPADILGAYVYLPVQNAGGEA
ncbi:MAG: DEAD/DEAH box helicase [bacterium]|nr:DEAD/DEAH box helicase [bacterium]